MCLTFGRKDQDWYLLDVLRTRDSYNDFKMSVARLARRCPATSDASGNGGSRFSDFIEANDPHGEHDFGKIKHDGQSYFWKIDYYDKEKKQGSPDPTDAVVTTRVLTLAEEY